MTSVSDQIKELASIQIALSKYQKQKYIFSGGEPQMSSSIFHMQRSALNRRPLNQNQEMKISDNRNKPHVIETLELFTHQFIAHLLHTMSCARQ